MYYDVDAEEFERQASVKYSSFKKTFLSLEIGTHVMRLCPPWSEERVPFRVNSSHHGFTAPDGRAIAPTCLELVFRVPPVAKHCVEAGILGREDYALWKQHGCPICELTTRLAVVGIDSFQPRVQYLWNVVVRGTERAEGEPPEQLVWGSSQKIKDKIMQDMKVYPNLFHPEKGHDFVITATGHKLSRRYTDPTFYPDPTPLGLPEDHVLHNLNAVVGRGARPYAIMVSLMEMHRPLMQKAQLTSAALLELKELKK